MNRLQIIAQQIAAPANNLSIRDHRTDKTYEIKVVNNTIRAVDLKEIKDNDGNILRTYDPGYMNTINCTSSITFIDGDKGILRYRGYPIQDLAESTSFPEVAFLLFHGELPTAKQLEAFSRGIIQNTVLPERIQRLIHLFPNDAHPMGIFVSAMAALGTHYKDSNPSIVGQSIYSKTEIRNREFFRVMGSALTVTANIARHQEGLNFCNPRHELSFTENFLYMVDKTVNENFIPNPKIVRALDVLFILHADHEQNCSTSAVRHLSSSNVDVYTAISGGIGALYGSRHGGANEAVIRMLEKIGTVDNVPKFVEDVKNRKELLMGFGHRVYKSYDPRAKIVKEVADDVFSVTGRLGLIDVAMALEKHALADKFFKDRHLYPNVDFYSGLIYKALGFPSNYYTVFFALARMAGWLSHWAEFQSDPENRIVRPFQLYKGFGSRQITKIEKRSSKLKETSLLPAGDPVAARRSTASFQT